MRSVLKMNKTYPADFSSVSVVFFAVWRCAFHVLRMIQKLREKNGHERAGKEIGNGKENMQWELKSFLYSCLEKGEMVRQVPEEMTFNCFAWNAKGLLFLKPENRNFLKCGD